MRRINQLILIFVLFTKIIFAADDWDQKFPSIQPSERAWHAMAYIGEDKVLLFGGVEYNSFPYIKDDTWIYDLSDNTWIKIETQIQPSGRYGHEMAHIGSGKVLLWGGYDGSPWSDETWIFDLNNMSWELKMPAQSPDPRMFFGLSYIGDDRALMFGGPNRNDTWIYDLSENSWMQIFCNIKPDARMWHDLAYIGAGKVLLYGGNEEWLHPGEKRWFDDTWIFDISSQSWIEMNPQSKPPAMYQQAMSYIGESKVMLYGWEGIHTLPNKHTWVYDLEQNNWINDENSIEPSRGVPKMSETSMDGSSYPVLFGELLHIIGEEFLLFSETWTFGGGDYTFEKKYQLTINKIPFEGGTIDPEPGTYIYGENEEVTLSALPEIGYIFHHWTGDVADPNSDHTIVIMDADKTITANFETSFEATAELVVIIQDLNLEQGVENSLISKLEGAMIAIAKDNYNAAAGKLTAFINQVEAQRNKKIPEEVADSLIEYAQKIIDSLPIGIGKKLADNLLCQNVPTDIRLFQNYPNPFNPLTAIYYTVPEACHVKIVVYNSLGQMVDVLIDADQSKGYHNILWNASGLPSGLYFYHIEAQGYKESKTMFLLK